MFRGCLSHGGRGRPPQVVAQGTVWAEGPFRREFRVVKGLQFFGMPRVSLEKILFLGGGQGPCHRKSQGGERLAGGPITLFTGEGGGVVRFLRRRRSRPQGLLTENFRV